MTPYAPARSQGTGEAHAAVVGGGSAYGERDVGGAVVERVQDELARAVGARAQRVERLARHEGYPRGGSHLDDGAVAGQKAVRGTDGIAERALDLGRDEAAVGCRHDRLDRALAAVGHAEAEALDVAERGAGLGLKQLRRTCRRDRPLERVACEDEAHHGS